MSVLDRVNRHKETDNSPTSPGTTIALADELEVTKRLRILVNQLVQIAGKDRQTWILNTVFDEIIEEINDRAAEDREGADALLSLWFSKCGMMLEWVATGNAPDEQDDFFDAFLALPEAQPEIVGAENA